MGNLAGKQIDATYHGLIKTNDELAIGVQAKRLQDGDGNDLPLEVGTQGIVYYDTQDFTSATVLGITGSQGFQGNQGFQGLAGNGIQGFQGFQGNAGTNGLQGAQGFQGLAGNGTQGFQGFQGDAGTNGLQGPQGDIGPQGITGAGFQGPQGFQGDTGTIGLQGFQGNDGIGTQGFQGFQGDLGPQGASGGGGGAAGLLGTRTTGTQGVITYDSSHGDCNWKAAIANTGTGTTNQLFCANFASYEIFTTPPEDRINAVRFHINIAGCSGATMRVGIYDTIVNSTNNQIRVNDLVCDLGTVAVDTTGLKTITLSPALCAGSSLSNSQLAVVMSPTCSTTLAYTVFTAQVWDGQGGIMFGDCTLYRAAGKRIALSEASPLPSNLSSCTHLAATGAPPFLLIR